VVGKGGDTGECITWGVSGDGSQLSRTTASESTREGADVESDSTHATVSQLPKPQSQSFRIDHAEATISTEDTFSWIRNT
jgi:hypothetical protein